MVDLIGSLGPRVLPPLLPAILAEVNDVLQQESHPGGGLLFVHELNHLFDVVAHVADGLRNRALGQSLLCLDVQVLADGGQEAAQTLQIRVTPVTRV